MFRVSEATIAVMATCLAVCVGGSVFTVLLLASLSNEREDVEHLVVEYNALVNLVGEIDVFDAAPALEYKHLTAVDFGESITLVVTTGIAALVAIFCFSNFSRIKPDSGA